MRKAFSILASTLLLAACSSTPSTLSFSELEMAQEELQNVIDPTAQLQLINEGKDIAYVVYQFAEVVAADIEEDGETVKVNLNVAEEDDPPETTVYKLTLDENHEIIEIFVNGKSTPIDVVSGI
ncbi:hypothetical protein [Planococcus sp. SSTMD024]|uniref:hypothetical protein n=1 Tax=Planococcus sp. SSTMD024 TaxID=3242163 RepID=UPI00351F30BB